MSKRSVLPALILREAIYRTLSAEERCLVALNQFEAALASLLSDKPQSGLRSPRQPVE
jgi:hypothetical protein